MARSLASLTLMPICGPKVQVLHVRHPPDAEPFLKNSGESPTNSPHARHPSDSQPLPPTAKVGLNPPQNRSLLQTWGTTPRCGGDEPGFRIGIFGQTDPASRASPQWARHGPSVRTSTGCGLAFVPSRVTSAVPLFVALEVALVDTLRRLCLLASVRHGAFVAVFRMKTVVYMAAEVARAMKPRACADEYAPAEPFRPVVTRGCATIGSGVIVAVGTFGSHTDIDADLSNCRM
jgi:hypothetical protein